WSDRFASHPLKPSRFSYQGCTSRVSVVWSILAGRRSSGHFAFPGSCSVRSSEGCSPPLAPLTRAYFATRWRILTCSAQPRVRLGATLAIAFLATASPAWVNLVPVAAFTGAIVAVGAAYVVGRTVSGLRSPTTLILAGVAIASAAIEIEE